MQPSFRIAIVGGGPSGLTLGVLLHKRGIPFTIFELRARPTPEELAKPAGSLDLHEESGLAALRECGLIEEFKSLTGDCTEAQKISTKDGKIIYTDEGELSNRPEISRHKLIKLLLFNLPDSTIQWRHKLAGAKSSATASGRTEIELDFGENGKQTFDLVIGADGAWSKVRLLLTDVKPIYSGLQCITMNIRQVTARYPDLAQLVGSGTFTCLGSKHGVFSQRSVDDAARIYVFLTADEDFASSNGLSEKTATQAKDRLIGDGSPLAQWGANIKELVAIACDEESADDPETNIDIKPLYRLPTGHTWEHQPGVTVTGDAAHLMCPWAGEGVNLAMRDSLQLSQAIIKVWEMAELGDSSMQTALDPLIKEFEATMVAGAKEMAERTTRNGEMMFGGEDGATDMANWFTTAWARMKPDAQSQDA